MATLRLYMRSIKNNFYSYGFTSDILETRKVQDGHVVYTDANQLLYINKESSSVEL